jgi:hypothetical protein
MNPDSWGFAIDGICDGVPDVAVILAFGIYLLKSMSNTDQNKDGYDRLGIIFNQKNKILFSTLKF